MKSCAIALALLLVLFVAACSRWFFVVPGGALSSTVRFEFYESLDQGKARFRIIEFSVFGVQNGIVQSPAIWSLNGIARLDQIAYGTPPQGLSQMAPALPLVPGQVYFVQAGDKPIVNSVPGYASAFFVVTKHGAIQECEASMCASIAAGA